MTEEKKPSWWAKFLKDGYESWIVAGFAVFVLTEIPLERILGSKLPFSLVGKTVLQFLAIVIFSIGTYCVALKSSEKLVVRLVSLLPLFALAFPIIYFIANFHGDGVEKPFLRNRVNADMYSVEMAPDYRKLHKGKFISVLARMQTNTPLETDPSVALSDPIAINKGTKPIELKVQMKNAIWKAGDNTFEGRVFVFDQEQCSKFTSMKTLQTILNSGAIEIDLSDITINWTPPSFDEIIDTETTKMLSDEDLKAVINKYKIITQQRQTME